MNHTENIIKNYEEAKTLSQTILNLQDDKTLHSTLESINNLNELYYQTSNLSNLIVNQMFEISSAINSIIQENFPDATQIKLSANHDGVSFNLYGLNIFIPLHGEPRIDILKSSMIWNQPLPTYPKRQYSDILEHMRIYFKEKDNHADWYTLMKYRLIPQFFDNKSKRYLHFLWIIKYKWKNDNRSMWMALLEKDDKLYNEQVQNYNNLVNEYNNAINTYLTKVLPLLLKISKNIFILDENGNEQLPSNIELFKQI